MGLQKSRTRLRDWTTSLLYLITGQMWVFTNMTFFFMVITIILIFTIIFKSYLLNVAYIFLGKYYFWPNRVKDEPYLWLQFKIILLFFLSFIYVFGCAGSSLLSGCSLVAGCGLSSFTSWVLEHRLSSCETQAFLLRDTWYSPKPGIKPMSFALAGGFFTTEPPGKPSHCLLKYTHSYSKLNSLTYMKQWSLCVIKSSSCS